MIDSMDPQLHRDLIVTALRDGPAVFVMLYLYRQLRNDLRVFSTSMARRVRRLERGAGIPHEMGPDDTTDAISLA